MDKTSEKITKDPKRAEAGCKGRENYMNKYKDSILNDAKKGGGDTTNTSNEITNANNTETTPATSTNNTTTIHTTSTNNTTTTHTTSTNNTTTTTTRSNGTYIYSVGILAVLAMGVCVFFPYNTFQPKNKNLVNEKADQPPKRRHML